MQKNEQKMSKGFTSRVIKIKFHNINNKYKILKHLKIKGEGYNLQKENKIQMIAITGDCKIGTVF